MYDVIVIGGGHNGLTTAAFLAKGGKRVLVLERRSTLGGLAGSYEFHKEYRTAGILHDSGLVRQSVIHALNLQQFGLKMAGKRAPVTVLADDGRSCILDPDHEKTATSLSGLSTSDASAYLDYQLFINKIRPWIKGLLNEPQPDPGDLGLRDYPKLLNTAWGLRRLGKKNMTELLKIAPMAVADFLNERFETDFLKAGLAWPSLLGSFNGPWSAFTTFNLLLWEAVAEQQVVGGPNKLIDALAASAKNNGAKIRLDSEVQNIQLSTGGAVEGVRLTSGEEINASVVAASCSPRATFQDFVAPRFLGQKLAASIANFRCRGTAAKVHLALNQKIKWKHSPDHQIDFVRTANGIDDTEKAFDAIKYGDFSEHPILDIFIPTNANPELAPEGHEVVSIIAQFVPYELEGGWTEARKKELGERVLAKLAQFVENLHDALVGIEVITPLDLRQRYNLTGGDLFHGEQAIDQVIGRPIPACVNYSTPISGLFLCGSGSHPGGGLTCMPGALASREILKANT